MDVITVTPALHKRWHRLRCPCCRRGFRVGQHVLRDNLRSVDFADGTRVIHINPCLRQIVDQAPEIDDTDPANVDSALDQLRRLHEAAVAG